MIERGNQAYEAYEGNDAYQDYQVLSIKIEACGGDMLYTPNYPIYRLQNILNTSHGRIGVKTCSVCQCMGCNGFIFSLSGRAKGPA